jgi:signal transduction histidine kinase
MQSHEVRAPLANIQGLISLIISNIDEEHEHFDYLKKIDLSCQKLDNQIIRMVLKSNEVEQIIMSESMP